MATVTARRDTSSESGFPHEYKRWNWQFENQAPETYVVQDLPPEDDERALQLLTEHFIRDESTCKSLKAAEDPQALVEMREFWRGKLAERCTLACYRLLPGGERRLVGLNVCYVSCAGSPAPDLSALKSASWRQILGILIMMESRFDTHAVLGVERYLSAAGLLVSPELRGRGLACELLKAREGLCARLGLTATATVFTASASQRVADKCGFRTLGEMSYAELAELGWQFYDIDTRSVKVMARDYQPSS